MVLVKSLKLKQKHLSQSLMPHMDVLSKLRHRHLVSILGHCIVTYQDHPNTASTVFIVHEHVSNGSLRDYLNGKVNSTNDGLYEILLHKLPKLMSYQYVNNFLAKLIVALAFFNLKSSMK